MKFYSTKSDGRRSPGLIFCAGFVLQMLAATPAFCDAPEFIITIKDHRFQPATLRIPTGLKVRIIVDNQEEIAEEFDSHALNREKHVPPKTHAILYIGPLEPGRYLFQGEDTGNPGGAALGVIEVQ